MLKNLNYRGYVCLQGWVYEISIINIISYNSFIVIRNYIYGLCGFTFRTGTIYLLFSSFSLASISSKHCCIVRVDLVGFCNASTNFKKSESSSIVPFFASFRERDFFGIFWFGANSTIAEYSCPTVKDQIFISVLIF